VTRAVRRSTRISLISVLRGLIPGAPGAASSDHQAKRIKLGHEGETKKSGASFDAGDLRESTAAAAPAAASSFPFVDDDKDYQPRHSQDKVQRRSDAAKLKHRTSLKLHDWQRYNYLSAFAAHREADLAYLARVDRQHARSQRRSGSPSDGKADASSSASISAASAGGASAATKDLACGIDRVHCSELSVQRFIADYEAKYKPVVIAGIADKWPATHKWTVNALSTGPYRSAMFK
jgi:hypothetical protein